MGLPIRSARSAVAAVCLGITLSVTFAACGGSDGSSASSGADAGGGGEGGGGGSAGCTPGAKDCVNDSLARVCPSDGASWLALPCASGSKCSGGACALDQTAKCTPGAGSCSDSQTALHCRADGSGLDQTKCPTGTTCAGPGLCVGACVVGESICMGTGVVATCADGQSYQQTACGTGDLCVATAQAPVKSAACKPAACTPDPQGCGFVCGDKTNAAADQTKSMSVCQATPAGYKWTAVTCAGSQSCNPSGGTCNNGQDTMAACRNACTPGEQRCVNTGGYQTCDANGTWSSTVTSCNPTATGAALACMAAPGSPGKVVCGDPLCAADYAGTCTASGQIRRCGSDGKIAATGTTCQSGICQAAGDPISGVTPGACRAQCTNGETRCLSQGATSYQTCTNGLWAGSTACPGTSTCFGYRTSTGSSAALCGAACAPGTHQCSGAQIQTCDATGQWTTAAACSFGVCTPTQGDAACLGQCVPGATVCGGSTSAVPGIDFATGYAASGTCTMQGTLPSSPTACTSGQFCRISSTGVATGCIECVGTGIAGGNERGLVDSKCVNTATQTQSCGANNTYAAAASCPNGTSCTTTADIPRYRCGDCFGTQCSNSSLLADTGGGCAAHGMTIAACGNTGDCCSSACQYTGTSQQPAPAYCK